MFMTLPPAALVLWFLVLHARGETDWRRALLLAAVFWGGAVTLITESLGAIGLLEFGPMAFAWGMVCAVLLWTLVQGKAIWQLRLDAPRISTLPRFEQLLLIYCFLLIIATGAFAWFSPPNTWDSMTYHMSRVTHWMQGKNLDFYPTAILRQLHSNPWAEYSILNFQILSGGDRFANFVQWSCMIGSIFGTSLLAKEIGANSRGQIFSAIACATIPMGILQGTSTQTDYVAAFWLVCVVYFSLRLMNNFSLLDSLAMGLALGLAILTKGTAYVFAFPFIVWLFASMLRKKNAKKLLLVGFALMVTVFSNAGHYHRNYNLYGSPLGPGTEGGDFTYVNEVINPSVIASNALRNLSLHLGISEKSDDLAENLIYKLHTYIGISPNDPRTTWADTEFHVKPISQNEDDAGNFFHLLLIGLALLLYFSSHPRNSKATIYATSIAAGFILFCAYLKWQPWHSRLQLPLFVLWAPFIGLILSRMHKGQFGKTLVVVLMMSSLPPLLFSATKPIHGKDSVFVAARTDQYFVKRRELASVYNDAVGVISSMKCSNVGLLIGIDDWEYPLSVLLNEKMDKEIYFNHVEVTNVSKKTLDVRAEKNTSVPCAIFSLASQPTPIISAAGRTYSKKWWSGPASVYELVTAIK